MAERGDAFTRDRMAWLERVQDDPEISAAGFCLAFAIARHLSRRTGEAWPGQKRLGDMAGVKERHVRTLLKALVDQGHLTIESGGFQRPDRYRPAIPDRHHSAAIDRHHSAALEGPDRHHSAAHTGTTVPPNPLKEPFEKSAARPVDEEKLAEELFAIMPKGSASRSNRTLVGQAAAEIVAGGVHPRALTLAVRGFVKASPDAKDEDGRFMGKAHEWLSVKRGWEAYLPSADDLFLDGRPQPDRDWLYRVRSWRRSAWTWERKADEYGPPPGQPGCRVPPDVVAHALASDPANDANATAPAPGHERKQCA